MKVWCIAVYMYWRSRESDGIVTLARESGKFIDVDEHAAADTSCIEGFGCKRDQKFSIP
jgi:hypothetical protein